MTTTLVITNDFPPRIGGIEGFVHDVCLDLGRDVVVLTSSTPEMADAEQRFDADCGFPVYRVDRTLLPTDRVGRIAQELMAHHRCRRILFGAAAPLALLAPRLRHAGAIRIVALTHGHEVWWSQTPMRWAIRAIGRSVDFLGTVSDYTSRNIETALDPRDRSKLLRIPPGVDTQRFVPSTTSAPVVLCVARMVRQKNHHRLLDAWSGVDVPDARLMLVGDGPQRSRLERRARALAGVDFLGPRSYEQLPQLYRRASLFALPVDTRLAGLYAEGYGRVFAEASAAGLPVIAGASGGVNDVVDHGHTGLLVDPRSVSELRRALHTLLTDDALRHTMGKNARRRAEVLLNSSARADAIRASLGLARSLP